MHSCPGEYQQSSGDSLRCPVTWRHFSLVTSDAFVSSRIIFWIILQLYSVLWAVNGTGSVAPSQLFTLKSGTWRVNVLQSTSDLASPSPPLSSSRQILTAHLRTSPIVSSKSIKSCADFVRKLMKSNGSKDVGSIQRDADVQSAQWRLLMKNIPSRPRRLREKLWTLAIDEDVWPLFPLIGNNQRETPRLHHSRDGGCAAV